MLDRHSLQSGSVRVIAALVIFASGFFFALTQQALGLYYWPGNDAALGFALFLALGTLLGLFLPQLWPAAQPMVRAGVARVSSNGRFDQFHLAKTALNLAIVLMLAAVLLTTLLAEFLVAARFWWSQRFLLSPSSWRLIAFALPALAGWLPGVTFGLLVQLIYSVFVRAHCSDAAQSGEDRVRRTLGSAAVWILASGAVGWACGYAAADQHLDQWSAMILIPVILYLLALFLSLATKTARHAPVSKEPDKTPSGAAGMLPELAAQPSRAAGLATLAVGWLGLWGLVHWQYCWANWYTVADKTPVSFLHVVILVPISALLAMRISRPLLSTKPRQLVTAVDRQGLALAAWGLVNLAALPATLFVLSSKTLPHFCGQIVLAVVLLALSATWFICLATSLGGLAIGRPHRFELWLALGAALTIGAIAGLLCLVIWQTTSLGNLIALALATIVAIASASITLIYDRPRTMPKYEKHSTAMFHVFCFVSLYGILGAVVIVVPILKSLWLRGTTASVIAVGEAASGCSFLIRRGSKNILIGPNETHFSPTTEAPVKKELLQLLTLLVSGPTGGHNSGPSALFVGLPTISDREIANCGIKKHLQTDLIPAFHGLATALPASNNRAGADLAVLRSNLAPVDIVLVLLPEPQSPRGWHLLTEVVRRAAQLADQPAGFWLIANRPPASMPHSRLRKLTHINSSNRLTVLHLRGLTTDWTVFGLPRAVAELTLTLHTRSEGGFELKGFWQ